MSRLSHFDLACDAPPYPVVCACRGLGFLAPEDTRWFRRSRFVRHAAGRGERSWLRPWKLLWMVNQSAESSCTCGRPLPALEQYTFVFRSGGTVRFELGQCERCRTMFWEEA
jgi:hypothetical protein